MKVAAMIAGLPRFRREFDDQLANLQNAEVDWFFCLWKGKFTSVKDNYVADTWPVDSREKTLEKLQANLPTNHRVTVLELPELPPYPHEGRNRFPHAFLMLTELFNESFKCCLLIPFPITFSCVK